MDPFAWLPSFQTGDMFVPGMAGARERADLQCVWAKPAANDAKQTFAQYAELHDMQQFRKIITCQRLWMEAN